MVRIFSLAFVVAGTQLPSASAAVTCETAVQWISNDSFDTACRECGAPACRDFLSVPVDEYLAALATCTGVYQGYATYVADPVNHEDLRISFLGSATTCAVEVDAELSSCEFGFLMIHGIDANCPKACNAGDDEGLRPCAEDECEHTAESCGSSGPGRCQAFLGQWSNMDDVKAAIAGIATCVGQYKAFAGYADQVVPYLGVLAKECSGNCDKEGDADFV
jgi:hypothetical protein